MKKNRGFTLTELLVIIVILVILTGIALPAFQFFKKGTELNESTEEVINTLRLAQNRTLASEDTSQWGVYFTTSTEPQQFILFRGEDFASRATSSDEVHKLVRTVEFSGISLTNNELVFDRITGTAGQSGSLSLRLKSDFSKINTIYIENSGKIGLAPPSSPSDENRIKDSRHVHFNYSRVIDTSTTTSEKLILTFDTIITEEIIISDNLEDGQLYWQGEVDVGGDIQKLEILTHSLNNPETQFSIHRDRRYNDKVLDIDITGDGAASPNLISYSADGQTTKGNSVYVTEPEWQ
jgi:prepilin-type N-terminal cleavage/methylation domain-containing protein